MIRKGFAAATAALIALSATPAPAQTAEAAPPKPKRQCFFANSVNSFSAVDDKTVNVRVGVRDYYQLELLTRCPDVDWTHQIALIARGGSTICDGMDATIVVKGPIGPQRCAVRNVRKLTPEEVAALDSRAKP